MNIGIVTTWFPSGAGYVSKAYSDILKSSNKVYIYARTGKIMKGDPSWDFNNVTWAPLHYNSTGIWKHHFLGWIKINKLDIIIFNEQRYWNPIILAKRTGVLVGAYVDYYTQMTLPLFELYDFLLCNTKRHYSVFNHQENCFYIPWGVNINSFSQKLNIKERPVTFIVSSGWELIDGMDRRGSLLALNAFLQVRGNCKLIVYSQIEIPKKQKDWVKKYEGDKRIEFRFGTFDPFPFNEGDIYVYPSRLDGIGLSLPEALASGLPSITTDSPPMNEFVENNVTGFLVKVDKYLGRIDGYYWAESICNINSLSEAMQQYVDKPNILREHSINAKKFAWSKLSWSENANNLDEYLRYSKLNPKIQNKNLVNEAKRFDKLIYPSFDYQVFMLIKRMLIFLEEKLKTILKSYN